MNRVFVTIGPITIYWYSLLILIGVLLGYNIAISYSKKLNYKTNAIMDMILYLVISAIIGARLYYVIFNFDAYRDNLLEIFMLWKGGLAIYGAIIGGGAYAFYYCRRHNIEFIKILDIYSLSLLLGQAIGRWGNFFNQEAYGGVTTYSALKTLHLPSFIIDGMYIDGAYRQPTFLYESIWCLIGIVILFFIRRKNTYKVGQQICFYLLWYGFGRFFIEGLRSDSLYFMGIRISQLVSFVLMIIGLIGLILINRKNKIKNKVKKVGGNDGRI